MKSSLQITIISVVTLIALASASGAGAAPTPGTSPQAGPGAAHNDRNNWSLPAIQEYWAQTGVGQQGRQRVHKSLPGTRGQEEYQPVQPGSAMQKAIPELVPLNELGGNEDGTKGPGDCVWYYEGVIPAANVQIPTPSKGSAAQIRANSVRGLTGKRITDTAAYAAMASVAADEVANVLNPETQARIAQASMQAQDTNTGNAFAEVTHNQATSAIEYCRSYLTNFTTDGGNRWNKLRDSIFVPIAVLLILPGAVLTQVKAIVSAGNPILGQMNPLEGILRSIVAIFLIPGTYLVINYGIDVSNAITYAINSEYTRQFGSDMYQDAICAEIRAFPSRQPSENRNAYDLPTARMGTVLLGKQTPFAKLEATLYANKIEDPCAGVYIVPEDRADEALPASAVAARMAMLASSMALSSSWNVLCAFQMAYLYYLWCVGPIAAALWVWPTKQLRDALPSWIEGALTLCFWSLFWNTTILLMACFRGVDETGTVTMSALNFLATACVKSAFDFSGLIRSAGAQASSMAEQAMKAAKGGGGGGTGGGGGSGNGNGSNAPNRNTPNSQPGQSGPAPAPTTNAPPPGASPNTAPVNQMPPMVPNPPSQPNPPKMPQLFPQDDVPPPPESQDPDPQPVKDDENKKKPNRNPSTPPPVSKPLQPVAFSSPLPTALLPQQDRDAIAREQGHPAGQERNPAVKAGGQPQSGPGHQSGPSQSEPAGAQPHTQPVSSTSSGGGGLEAALRKAYVAQANHIPHTSAPPTGGHAQEQHQQNQTHLAPSAVPELATAHRAQTASTAGLKPYSAPAGSATLNRSIAPAPVDVELGPVMISAEAPPTAHQAPPQGEAQQSIPMPVALRPAAIVNAAPDASSMMVW
jgi:hypothetical protein